MDLDTELEEEEAVPPLEWCLAPMLMPEAKLGSHSEAGNEDLGGERYRVEPIHPYVEELQEDDIQQWNLGYPTPVEEEPATPSHHSIHVQTSKHLFWADKVIQASEQNLQRETSRQLREKSTEKKPISHLNRESVPKDTLRSQKPPQNPSTQPELPDTGCEQPSSTHSSSSLPPVISLQDVVNLATSLAIASSSKVDLSTLGYAMKAPQQKAVEPSPEPPPTVESATPQAKKEPGQEKLPELLRKPPERLLEAGEPEKGCKQKDKNKFPLHLDLSKLGPQKAVIEGEVKFLQPPVRSSPPTGARKE